MLRSIAILIAALALTSLSAAADGPHTALTAADNPHIFAHESPARSSEFLTQALAKLGLTPPGGQQIGWFIVLGFLFGIVLVFAYAAMRPRFGASAKTALIAGGTLWLAGLPQAISQGILGIMPSDLAITSIVLALIETEVAAIAGAWVYKET